MKTLYDFMKEWRAVSESLADRIEVKEKLDKYGFRDGSAEHNLKYANPIIIDMLAAEKDRASKAFDVFITQFFSNNGEYWDKKCIASPCEVSKEGIKTARESLERYMSIGKYIDGYKYHRIGDRMEPNDESCAKWAIMKAKETNVSFRWIIPDYVMEEAISHTKSDIMAGLNGDDIWYNGDN